MYRLKRKEGLVSLVLLAIGLAALASSVLTASNTLAFIGLGLTFWGALLLYVTNERYVKQTLLSSTTASSLETLNQILSELHYLGPATYLPTQYVSTDDTPKVYIPKNPTARLPPPDVLQQQGDRIFLTTPDALLLIPPGLALTRLFEETLGASFTNVDLTQLRQSLPKLLVEDLELAEALALTVELRDVNKSPTNSPPLNPTHNTLIHVTLTNFIDADICHDVAPLATNTPLHRIGSPIISALACILTKMSGKPVTIEGMTMSADEKTCEVTYGLQETGALVIEVEEMAPLFHRLRLVGFALMAGGALILVVLGLLIWYDITTWGKDIVLILFGSRTGEAMSLGRGIRAIHYLLIGVALLFLGLITFNKKIMQALRQKLQALGLSASW
jgi:hypothetical protein